MAKISYLKATANGGVLALHRQLGRKDLFLEGCSELCNIERGESSETIYVEPHFAKDQRGLICLTAWERYEEQGRGVGEDKSRWVTYFFDLICDPSGKYSVALEEPALLLPGRLANCNHEKGINLRVGADHFFSKEQYHRTEPYYLADSKVLCLYLVGRATEDELRKASELKKKPEPVISEPGVELPPGPGSVEEDLT